MTKNKNKSNKDFSHVETDAFRATCIKIPSERFLFEVSKDGVTILDTTTGMKEIDGNTQAFCDLCSAAIGPMKDIEHIESPEAISKGQLSMDTGQRKCSGRARR